MFNFHQLQGLCCSQILHITELSNLTLTELIAVWILRHQFLLVNFSLLLLTLLVLIVENG